MAKQINNRLTIGNGSDTGQTAISGSDSRWIQEVEWYEVNTRKIFSDLFIYITETLQYMVVILMDPDQSII